MIKWFKFVVLKQGIVFQYGVEINNREKLTTLSLTKRILSLVVISLWLRRAYFIV